MIIYLNRITAVFLAAFLIGCGPAIQRKPVPESLVEVAQVIGLESD